MYRVWLASLKGVTRKTKISFVEKGVSEKELFFMEEKLLRKLQLCTEKECDVLLRNRNLSEVEKHFELLQKHHIHCITIEDRYYPRRLQNIQDPPYAIFYRGSLPEQQFPSVAVVGARRCSEYGRSIAISIGKQLGSCRVNVISGMALGIDLAAHAGCLQANGSTYGILGCGVDICYPPSSKSIYNTLIQNGEKGGILSEYPPGTDPIAYHFPERNRLISGLSDIVVVVEAAKKSGTLITVDCALEQGKDIYVVPGRITDRLSYGCNRLIEQGAQVLYDKDLFLKNVLKDLKKQPENNSIKKIMLEKQEIVVYSCVDLYPKSIRVLIEETQLSVPELLDTLQSLKGKGLVIETCQNYFVRQE